MSTASDSYIKENRIEYLTALKNIERVYIKMLQSVKEELRRTGHDDVNDAQAIIIYGIGSRELSFKDVHKQCYAWTNITYNITKLVNSGYVTREPAKTDRRSVRISLTSKGMEIYRVIDALYDRQFSVINDGYSLTFDDLKPLNIRLSRLELLLNDTHPVSQM